MQIPAHTYRGGQSPRRIRIFVLTACFFAALNAAGSWRDGLYAFTQKSPTPIVLQESHPYKLKKNEPLNKAAETGPAGKMPEASSQELTREQQQRIIEKNTRIRRLQEGIIDQKIKILGSRKKERTLLGDLEKIETELQEQKNLLAELRTKSERQELLLSDKQEYLRQVLAEKRKHQAVVKKRLAAYYRMGSVGLMNVVFSAESLPELLEFKEYFTRMVQYDHAIIQTYLAELKESNLAREEHAREKLRLMKLADEVREKEKQLTLIRQEKNQLLQKVNTEQQLYQQAVAEIEEAVADLAITLQKVQAAAAPLPQVEQPAAGTETETDSRPPDRPESPVGFTAQKGRLAPPVPGTVINRFGGKIKGRFDSSTTASGIDIKVEENVEIRAVYDGRVIHAGYLRGYGNLMIIDHGQQYFTLTSRAAEFYRKEGNRVLTGEVIGLTGEGDPLYGEGLHFEIRHGANPEDPLLWLKRDALTLQAVESPAK